MNRYKQNLKIVDDMIISYSTHVANIDHEKGIILQKKWYSATTQKHINYVAREFNYKVQSINQ
ncbi:hypothetical protein UFOVP386_42 [uncultured Caudovirales phage]|uniref:DUF8033 domain-containing protein n=1 Tax=uncultured Caudovirales phage TaxID=2100421 RepID=A0A6J7X5A7_9CAUD|nr:hypothetical protein UFOVP386_42 [uncultured Caudovirales phage]